MELPFLILCEANGEFRFNVYEYITIRDTAVSSEDVQVRACRQVSEEGMNEDPEHSFSSAAAEAVGVKDGQSQRRRSGASEEESSKDHDGHPKDTDQRECEGGEGKDRRDEAGHGEDAS